MAKISPAGRIGQQVGVKRYKAPVKRDIQAAAEKQAPRKPTVDYDAAWKTAKGHWGKGMAGAYLQHMGREASRDPQTGAVYKYLKELDRQTRAGNISPGRTKGSLLATPSEVAKQKANIEFFQKRAVEKAAEKVKQETVLVDDRGYSVAPELQSKFIKDIQRPSGSIAPTLPQRKKGFRILLSEREKMMSKQDVIKGRFAEVVSPIKTTYYWGLESGRELPGVKGAREKIKESKVRERLVGFAERLPKVKDEKLLITPAKVRGIFDPVAEYTLLAGEKASSLFKSSGIVEKENPIFAPSPFTRGQVKEALSEVYLFSGLGPLMRTTGEVTKTITAGEAAKFKKLTKEPIAREVTVEPKYSIGTTTKEVFGIETKATAREGKRFLKIKRTKPETVKITETKPTQEWFGQVKEIRKTGILRKPKEFFGEVKISKEGYVETIKYSPKITKITKIDIAGIGKTKILEKGRVVARLQTKPGEIPKLKLKETKTAKDFRKSFGEPATVERTIIDGRSPFGIKQKQADLSTGLFKIKAKKYVEFGEDIRKGLSQKVERYQEISDIVKAGPRRQIKAIKGKGRSVVYKKDIGQEILYGKGSAEPIQDAVAFSKTPTKQRLMKTTAPRIQRAISERIGQRVTTTYDPTGIFPRPLKTVKKTKAMYPELTDIKSPKEFSPTLEKVARSPGKLLLKTKTKAEVLQKLYIKSPQEYLSKTKVKTKVPSVPITRRVTIPKTSPISARVTSIASAAALATKTKQISLVTPKAARATVSKSATDQLQDVQKVSKNITTRIFRGRMLPVQPAQPSTMKPAITQAAKIVKPYGKTAVKIPSFTSVLIERKRKIKQGYIPQAKTKSGKWVSLSKDPMSRSAALSRGARATDQTLSAQFRVRKTRGEVVGNGDSYFGMTKPKYRPYKLKKGKPVKLHNQFIEKRGKRIDTRGEKKGLKLSKYVKQQGWLASKEKTKTKSPWLI